MKSYGQFCPVAKAAEVFCERWTPIILRDLAADILRQIGADEGPHLFAEGLHLRRLKSVPDVQTVLSSA